MRVTQHHQPASPQANRALAYALLAGVFTTGMLGTTLPTPLYALYQENYHFPAVVITVIFTVYALGVLAALLWLGRVSDHFGRRPVLLAALGMACASTVLFVFAQDIIMLLAGRLLSGLAAGLLTGTATAGLVELQPTGNMGQATRVATAANMGGLGLGPLVAGLFAQFAPAPTRLVFIVYLVLLVITCLLVAALPETVREPDHVLDVRPRLGIESYARGIFWQSAVTAFCIFTLLGLFGSLASTFLRTTLHEPNLALAGVVVFLLFGAATVSQLLLHSLSSRTAQLAGLVLLLLGLTLIELGLALPGLWVFLVGTVVAGVGTGLAFMGSLAAINQAAPPERKAEMVSAFFVVAYIGITIPVVGVGLIAQETSLLIATLCLAALNVILLLLTLATLLWPSRRKAGNTR